MSLFSPEWIAAARDPAEAAAHLASRRLVRDELGEVYGPGVLPDWVKAAQAPPTTVGEAARQAIDKVDPPSAAKAVGDTAAGMGRAASGAVAPVLDSVEGTVRPSLEAMSKRTGLSGYLPKSNVNPSDQLGALGTGLRPAILGTGIGAGMGLLGGLTGKKKRPISGMLFGGLMGGAAGLGGGYLYDRLSSPTSNPEKPTPDQVIAGADQIRNMDPGLPGLIHEGVSAPEAWKNGNPERMAGSVLTGAGVGAGLGGAVGGATGAVYRGLANNAEAAGVRPQLKYDAVVGPNGTMQATPPATAPTLAPAGTKLPKVPAGAKLPPGAAVQVTQPSFKPPVSKLQSAGAGAWRGGRLGGLAGGLFGAGNHLAQVGREHLNETNPGLVKDNLTRAFANAAAAPPVDDPAVAQARQELATRVQAELQTLSAQQAAGQKLDPAQRARLAELYTQGNQLRMINLNPPAAPK